MRLRFLLVLLPWLAAAQNLREFEKKVTEFTLANGMHFIVVERHEAPVVAFHTYVNAGSVDDPEGGTGIAHMFEHMAFKGTETIGTRNWAEEKKALDLVEELYDKLEGERAKGPRADEQQILALSGRLRVAIDRANAHVIPNLYPRIIEENGGVGMNAQTGLDATEYFYSLPSNRIELWFLLESARFLQPVLREFYKERDVVMEEYRMRVESDPQGKLTQSFLGTAFVAHPYRRLGTGWPSDVQNLRRSEAAAFYQKHYVPANMTMAMAGDVTPAQARAMAEKYFGRLQARPLPPPPHTVEPPQEGGKIVEVQSAAQPLLLAGYKRPDQYDRDDPVFDVIGGILSSGRTGLLYKKLVRDKKTALATVAADTFPGGKYPNLFVFYVAPSLGHTIEENEKELFDLIETFKAGKPDAATLARVKTKTRASLVRRLASNEGLAAVLPFYYANYGDWRKLFTSLNDIEKVTAEDVQRVAQKYFVPERRTIAHTAPPAGAAPAVRRVGGVR